MGTLFVLIGVAQLLKVRGFRRRAERVPGVVVDMQEGVSPKYGSLYYPVLEFTTREDREVRTTARVGTRPAPARVGEKVTVAYDRDDPESAEIEGKGLVLVALMSLFVLVGLSAS